MPLSALASSRSIVLPWTADALEYLHIPHSYQGTFLRRVKLPSEGHFSQVFVDLQSSRCTGWCFRKAYSKIRPPHVASQGIGNGLLAVEDQLLHYFVILLLRLAINDQSSYLYHLHPCSSLGCTPPGSSVYVDMHRCAYHVLHVAKPSRVAAK